MAHTLEELQHNHPCFGGCKYNAGRIHLPVSPGCNLGCRFCDRQINDVEDRPGVTSTVITPEEAAGFMEKALELCPDIKVAGIAGPGDTLASDKAFETFRRLGKEFPDLLKCMSTNGLLLSERAQEVIDVGIDTLTVTVNAVNPVIEEKINEFIIYHGKRYDGVEGAEILIRNQLEGIRKVAAAGVTVKINTVLIPDINGDHIAEIAKTVKEAGALIYNIIPLIPQHQLKDHPKPTLADIIRARAEASQYIEVFTHCAHCRADAVGVPGVSEYSRQVFGWKLQMPATFSHG